MIHRVLGCLMPLPLAVGLGFLAACLAVAGCGPRHEITEVVLPRQQTGLPSPRTGMDGMPPRGEGPRRMIVAMIERPDAAWFFKIEGRPDAVAAAQSNWHQFMQQVRFTANGNPEWTLPLDWQELSPRPQRFATLLLPAGSTRLELAVSSLPAGQSVLGNVNRWLGQLGLSPTDEAGLIDLLSILPTEAGEYLVFDQSSQGADRAAMVIGSDARRNGLPQFAAPAGWQFNESSQFVAASYVKDFGGPMAQIAISRLPRAGMTWEAVVSMWLEQVGLSATELASWVEQTEAILVGGEPARRIVLRGGDETKPALVGVRVDTGDDAWYFKLFGDRSAVEQGHADFDALLKSVRFESEPAGREE